MTLTNLFNLNAKIWCLQLFLSLEIIGPCPVSLRNTVLREGETFKLPQPINQNCDWSVIPSDNFYNAMLNIISHGKGMNPAFAGSLVADTSGITILKASTTPVGGAKWSPAGLYNVKEIEARCNSSAKVAVISTSKIINSIHLTGS